MLSERAGVCAVCSKKKQRICLRNKGEVNPFEEEFGSSSDSGQGAWSVLSKEVASNWAESVVSLASFDEGGSIFFACTGIIINDSKTNTTFLTSLSLVRSIHDDDDSKIFRTMRIKVRLPNNHVMYGLLQSYDLKYNIAVVNVKPNRGLRVACLDHQQQFESHSKVVALGRCFSSGKLMATTGMLTDNPRGIYREDLATSTCEITMAATGGPLIDFDGNFVGMNFYAEEGTPFLPKNTILEHLAEFARTYALRRARRKKEGDSKVDIKRGAIKMPEFSRDHKSDLEGSSRGERTYMDQKHSICPRCDPEGQPELEDDLLGYLPFRARWPYDFGGSVSVEARRNKLRSSGYPFPVLEDIGMRLLNNFEEEFGEDIWTKLTKKVASNMSRSVVALASFSGDARFFACTGIFIDCNESTTRVLTSASLVRTSGDENKIVDNLKIEVCLPDKRHATGTLQHYNLHYNIAVISIMGFRCTRTAQIYNQVQIEHHGEVVAVGRVYESGKLMATGGILIEKPSKLHCKELRISSCKTTKAGIGGPLIDFDGNFIGMDFYGLEETPYLPRNIILELLRNFDAKTLAADFSNDQNPNRWPVLKPYWCYPSWHMIQVDDTDLKAMTDWEPLELQ